jgi:DNA-damage-inducible protein D
MSYNNIVLFENRQVRRYYDGEKEIWYFSIVDIVEALTESVNPTDY